MSNEHDIKKSKNSINLYIDNFNLSLNLLLYKLLFIWFTIFNDI